MKCILGWQIKFVNVELCSCIGSAYGYKITLAVRLRKEVLQTTSPTNWKYAILIPSVRLLSDDSNLPWEFNIFNSNAKVSIFYEKNDYFPVKVWKRLLFLWIYSRMPYKVHIFLLFYLLKLKNDIYIPLLIMSFLRPSYLICSTYEMSKSENFLCFPR